MIRKCLCNCGRDVKNERSKFFNGRCAQRLWRLKNKARIRNYNKMSYHARPKTNVAVTTKFLSHMEIYVRAIDENIADKKGGYRWQ